MDEKIPIYIAVNFECLWYQGIAVVAARSEDRVIEILKKETDEYAKGDGIRMKFNDSELRLRKDGKILPTGKFAYEEGVIYSGAFNSRYYRKSNLP
jgi:hypothetical protein